MSLPQALVRGVGGTVSVDLLARPTSATVDVLTDAGAAIKSAAAATVSTANTTLTAPAARGATSIAVAAATGIAAGSVVWLQDDPEPALVYKVAALVLSLRRPLIKAHISGAVVEGTRVSYAVLAADCATRFWDGRCRWTLADASIVETAVECVEHPFTRQASLQDLWDTNPQTYEVLDATVDTERLLDLGMEHILEQIGAKARARVFTGSNTFKRATALAAWRLHYEPNVTPEGTALFERYVKLVTEAVASVVAITPRDENQDGAVTSGEKLSMRSIVLRH